VKLHFLKRVSERFTLKVFLLIAVFLFITSLSFMGFFIYQQSQALTGNLIRNGELLTGILAYSVRLGVFAEDKELLDQTVQGIFQQEDVLEVSVLSLEKELLSKEKNPATKKIIDSHRKGTRSPRELMGRFKEEIPLLMKERPGEVEIWSPVGAAAGYATDESLMFGTRPGEQRMRIIGFAGITVDKTKLNKTINGLWIKGILIGAVFLLIGCSITYFLAKRMTRPLNKLTEEVITLGKGGVVEPVPVETEDEVGRLAEAFNAMSDSLKRREAEKWHLEEQLRHAQKMEAIGTLAGGIAHDFNNILTAIIGYGNLLQLQIEKDSPHYYNVEQILASADKASNLTQSLLAFGRKQLISPKAINLNTTVTDVQKLLTRLIREDIEIKHNLTQEELVVMADVGQIEQILMNLATNARDAMPEGGVITIATESIWVEKGFFKADGPLAASRYALLSFSDTGVGIDDATKERIFDPFFTTKEVGKGTGLGLSMIYGIIKQHQGYIDVSSTPGKGTSFNIYLPLIWKEAEEQQESGALEAPRGGTERILIAEDDEGVRMLSKDVLTRAGYRLIEAVDGEEAIRKFSECEQEIQLLLLDVIMPKKNGKEVYEAIKKIRPDMKALFISGYTSEIISTQGMIDQDINFVGKPVSPDTLLRKVREVLDS